MHEHTAHLGTRRVEMYGPDDCSNQEHYRTRSGNGRGVSLV